MDAYGLNTLATACGVTYQAIQRWERDGLPHSEYSGATEYAKKIERMTDGRVKAAQLLEWSKRHRQIK